MFPGHHLQRLPIHQRKRLAEAFETGTLPDQPSAVALGSTLGVQEGLDGLIADLDDLALMGISGRAVAAWMRAVEQNSARNPAPDLVWSGPEVPGVPARETRQVYEELLSGAHRSVWMSTFVYFDGPRAFEQLAQTMDTAESLRVTLLLNIQRNSGDTTAADQLVGASPTGSGSRIGQGPPDLPSTTTPALSIHPVLRVFCMPRPWWWTARWCS